MELSLSLVGFFYRRIFFCVNQFHWQVSCREITASTTLMFVEPFM